jgi:hypothetical protein
MNTKYLVELSDEKRQHLEKLTSSGNAAARQIKRAHILLKSDRQANWSYEWIMEAFNVSAVTIAKVRKTFVEQGLEAPLQRKKPDREYEHVLDGENEAHLIALACSEPPAGRKHWRLRLLQDRFVKLRHVDKISYETIRRVLKKNELKPWLREQWCIPPPANAAFVCQMEDVLKVHKLLYDAKRPMLCMDEMPKQLLAQTRDPILCQAGRPARQDYQYKRNGTADLFMLFELLQGKRFVEVAAKRRKVEWATVMKQVADTLYPQAEKIIVVLDNLNTHTPSAFYGTFEPEEARRLVERFEFHFTPKHGSWLNMAEIELSALVRQCLDQRIPDLQTLTQEVQAWQQQRNNKVVTGQWQFQTTDARTKLKYFYLRFRCDTLVELVL